MTAPSKYDWFNDALFDIIPIHANRILDIGCDTGLLGKALKDQKPERYVAGIEIDASAAHRAKTVLDDAYHLDIENQSIDDIGGNFDVIIMGDVVEHLFNPLFALEKIRPLLAENGELITSIPNVQHYSIFRHLLKGDFQYRPTGLLDHTHVRFYCLANIDKLMLDAGLIPRLYNRNLKNDPALVEPMQQLMTRLGVDQGNLLNMETFQYQTASRQSYQPKTTHPHPLSFVVHSKFTGILKDNFYSSPVFKQDHIHQILIYRRGPTLPEAWNSGFHSAKNDYVIFVREEVYLPKNWDLRLMDQIQQLEQLSGKNWIAGLSGNTTYQLSPQDHVGSVLHPGESEYCELMPPFEVPVLGDDVIIIPKDAVLQFDLSLGEYFHGADISQQAKQQGVKVYCISNPCLNNSPYQTKLPPGHEQSRRLLTEKWPDYG